MLLAAVRHGGPLLLSPRQRMGRPSRRTDAAADRNSSAAPGRGARRVLWLAPQRLAIARSHSTDTRKVDADIEASLDEMTPSSALMHPDVPDTTSSPGQMKTRHLLRHIQRALARVIGELTSSGTGYTGPEQTNEKRISGSGNRSCLGCRRTYQPFMQGRRPADDQQHRRAERRECAPRPGRGPITMREQTHRVTWFPPCRFRALRDHFGGARGLRAEEPILSFLLSSPNGPAHLPGFLRHLAGVWRLRGPTGHVRVDFCIAVMPPAACFQRPSRRQSGGCWRRYPLHVRTTKRSSADSEDLAVQV